MKDLEYAVKLAVCSQGRALTPRADLVLWEEPSLCFSILKCLPEDNSDV